MITKSPSEEQNSWYRMERVSECASKCAETRAAGSVTVRLWTVAASEM